MFDFSFTELLLVGAVALVVLGPERLPKVARTAGRWIGKIQRLAGNFKNELTQHAEYADLNNMKEQLSQTAKELRQELGQIKEAAAPVAEYGTAAGETDSDSSNDTLPAWERLPEQRTPADFGKNPDGTPMFTASAPVFHGKSLHKQAMSRKRDLRPRHRPLPRLRSRR